MSINERFNLFWITRAMAVSHQYDYERYYYDSSRHSLFSIIKLPVLPRELIILDKYNLRYDVKTEADLAVRLELLADEDSTIIEIPRLSVHDKKEIQQQFLSILSDKIHHRECLLAVNEQMDEDGFVLDSLLNRRSSLTGFIPYWETLKLQLSFAYMSLLTRGISDEAYLEN
jgi:hypothetical protein